MNTFIFDLDGTLLPMPNQELFLDTYLKALSKKVVTHGLDPQLLIKAVWTSTGAMIKNDGTMTNEQRFWEMFCSLLGEEARSMETIFDHFYRNEFSTAKDTTFAHPHAEECIRLLKQKGYLVVLATNPLFPRIATFTRMQWAGLDPEDFLRITTYENSCYAKPNLDYYKEILNNIGKKPEECIMIGNDVREDMCAARLGMATYLLKDCLICPEDEDITHLRQGNFDDLLELIKEIPDAD
jgi:FMN phosphatase YigB (HAD superfamily)